MILLPVLTVLALAPGASHWNTPLWDSSPEKAAEAPRKHRPIWWGEQCAESHPTLVWNWVDALRSEEGLREELPELLAATTASMLPRVAGSAHLGSIKEDVETWGGPPVMAMHGVLDLCYVEVVTLVEAVGAGAEAFEELGLETRGRGSLEVRYGHDLLLRPSRFVFASAARGLDAAAIGIGGTVGWAVAAPGGEATQWLVRPMPTVEIGPRFLWDVSPWLALTLDINTVVSGPAAFMEEMRTGAQPRAPGLKVLMGGIVKAPEEPLVALFKRL